MRDLDLKDTELHYSYKKMQALNLQAWEVQ